MPPSGFGVKATTSLLRLPKSYLGEMCSFLIHSFGRLGEDGGRRQWPKVKKKQLAVFATKSASAATLTHRGDDNDIYLRDVAVVL